MKHLLRLSALLFVFMATGVWTQIVHADEPWCPATFCNDSWQNQNCNNITAWQWDGNGCDLSGNYNEFSAVCDAQGGRGADCQTSVEFAPQAQCWYNEEYCTCRGVPCM